MKELVAVFARIGCLGFGGPIATIAMMEEEVRRRRGWLTEAQFAEVYAVCKMLPGPVAVQVAIYLGMLRKGRLGGLLAGLLYILPAFLLVLGFSALYVTHKIGVEYQQIFEALQTGALVVILISTLALARPIWVSWKMIALAVLSAVVIARFPLWEPLVILASGVGGALAVTRMGTPRVLAAIPIVAKPLAPALLPAAAGTSNGPLLLKLFWVCFKAGAFVFGTGLAVIPMLEADFVQNQHWLNHSEFMDGLMIGQITPGPVTTSVAFFGYKTAGLAGAVAAGLGIFLPSFVNVLVIVPWIWRKFSGTPQARAFTTWALPAVVGGVLAITLKLGAATIHSWPLAALFLIALAGTLRWKIPAWTLILACGAVGAAWSLAV